jgi:taurine dioxygenase
MLYVCSMMTSKVLGLPDDESEQLLEELFAHINDPAGTWQHDWSDGDLVIWDNLAVQHARDDVAADGPVRTLRKATSPETPVGVVKQTYATQR